MKILHIINVRWYNACAWYAVELASIQQEEGHTCLILALPDSPPLYEAEKLGLQTAVLPLNEKNPVDFLRLIPKLKSILATFQPDIVNCHRGEAFLLFAYLRRFFPFALVRTRGDQRLPKNSALNRFLYKNCTDAHITTQSRMARHLTDVMGLPADCVHTIVGGIGGRAGKRNRFFPSPQTRASMRAQYGLTDQDFLFALIGRLDTVKGHRETLAAFRLLLDQYTGPLRPRLLCMGVESAFTQADLNSWITEAGLSPECVLCIGRVEKPEDCLQMVDLGIIASLGSEAVARVALEFLACTIPFISSSVGVMPDLLPVECRFPPGDVPAMADCMACALEAEVYAGFKQICVKRAAEFTAPVFYSRTMEAYTAASIHKTLL